jgi:hypothetical protein
MSPCTSSPAEDGRRHAAPLKGDEHVGVPLGGNRVWRFRHGLWLVAAAALPKCVLCVLGYLALAGGMTRSAAELCGATAKTENGMLAWVGAGMLFVGVVTLVRLHRRRVSGMKRSDR